MSNLSSLGILLVGADQVLVGTACVHVGDQQVGLGSPGTRPLQGAACAETSWVVERGR